MKIYEDFKYFIYLLEIIGLWPFRSAFRRRLSLLLFCLDNFSFGVSQVLSISQKPALDVLIENLFATTFTVELIIRYIIIHLKAPDMKLLYLQAVKNCESIQEKDEQEHLNKFIRLGKILGLLFSGCMIIGLCSSLFIVQASSTFMDFVFPLENKTRSNIILFHQSYILFTSEDRYWLSSIHMTIAFTSQIVFMAGFNSVIIISSMLICGLFSITSKRLENIIQPRELAEDHLEDPDDDPDIELVQIDPLETEPISGDISPGPYANSRINLSRTVDLHCETLWHCQLLEDVFSWVFLFDIICGTIGLSLAYFYAVHAKVPVFRTVLAVFVTILIDFFLLSMNWLGQEITDYSEKVHDAGYANCWYLLSPKKRKLVLLILQGSTRPVVLTAGKIMPISMASYSELMNTSKGYFTLLVTLTE